MQNSALQMQNSALIFRPLTGRCGLQSPRHYYMRERLTELQKRMAALQAAPQSALLAAPQLAKP